MSPWVSDIFLRSQSDERLVALARSGHDRAFAVIVERYRRQLYAFARSFDSAGGAEDLVQQAFLSAFAALQSGTEVAHLRGWLHQILRSTAIRASGSGPSDVELDDHVRCRDPVEDIIERRELVLAALTEVARLPGRQRDALVKTAIQGRSRAEVASTMGVSEGAVRQLVHRARSTVRGAATALTPYPFAQWLAGSRPASDPDGIAQIVVGAGTASTGALALKLGAVAVTGILVVPMPVPHRHSRRTHHPAVTHSRRALLAGVVHAPAPGGTNPQDRTGSPASRVSLPPRGETSRSSDTHGRGRRHGRHSVDESGSGGRGSGGGAGGGAGDSAGRGADRADTTPGGPESGSPAGSSGGGGRDGGGGGGQSGGAGQSVGNGSQSGGDGQSVGNGQSGGDGSQSGITRSGADGSGSGDGGASGAGPSVGGGGGGGGSPVNDGSGSGIGS